MIWQMFIANSGKLARWRGWLAVGLLAFAMPLCAAPPKPAQNTASTSNTAPLRSTPMTPPKTPQEIWSRILMLLNTHGGFVNHSEVEAIMGMRFTEVKKETTPPSIGADFFYSTKTELPDIGEVDMGLFEDGKFSSFSIGWGPEYASTPDCLKLDDAKRDLEALDWVAGHRVSKPSANLMEFLPRSALEVATSTSSDNTFVLLMMPNQFSQCVNKFIADIRLP